MMLAGLDGVQNKTEPAAPIDKDIYELPPNGQGLTALVLLNTVPLSETLFIPLVLPVLGLRFIRRTPVLDCVAWCRAASRRS